MAETTAPAESPAENPAATGGDSQPAAQITQATGWAANNCKKTFDIQYPKGNPPQRGFNINNNKVLHLCIYQHNGPNILNKTTLSAMINSINAGDSANKWDNWKDMTPPNRANKARLVVPPSVQPILSNFTVKGGFTIGQKDIVNSMKDGGGQILGTLNDLGAKFSSFGAKTNVITEAVRGGVSSLTDPAKGASAQAEDISAQRAGTLISKFSQFPIADPEQTSYENPGGISLEFRFGNGGLYNGEAEVVRPIAAIENLLAPGYMKGGKDSQFDAQMMVSPLASPAMLYAALWGSTLGSLGGVLDSAVQFVKGAGSAVVNGVKDVVSGENPGQAITETVDQVGEEATNLGLTIQEAVIDAQDIAVAALAPWTTLLFMRLGNEIMGPFSIDTVSHTLDYSQVDERGYPTKGTLDLSVKYIMKPTNIDILTQHGYAVSGY